jgi:hypothetical protein
MPTGTLILNHFANPSEKGACKKSTSLIVTQHGVKYRRDGGYQISVLLPGRMDSRLMMDALAQIAIAEKIEVKNAQYFVVKEVVGGVEVYQCKIEPDNLGTTAKQENTIFDDSDEYAGLFQGTYVALKKYFVSHSWLDGQPMKKDFPFSREKIESLLS